MQFLSPGECQRWAQVTGIALGDARVPTRPSNTRHSVVRAIPPEYTRLTWFCRHVERSLRPRTDCLLWVTDWGIWEENQHLYYRLRESYGDRRLLTDAPGHLFLDFEAADLVTFLEVAVLCGWDAHVLPASGYARAFLSHDEFVEFAADDANPDLAREFGDPLAAIGGGTAA